MRIMFIHSDYLEYKVREKAVKDAENIEKDEERFEEPLVCFVSVEEKDSEKTAENAVNEIIDVFDKVKAKSIVIYPYAHLSSSLAPPSKAIPILNKIREKIEEKGYNVYKVPFGWYKSFKLSCKGHPLSELSKQIGEEEEPEALRGEKTLKTYWKILENNKLYEINEYDFTGHENLKYFVDYEMSGTRAVKEIPPHVKFMRSLELVDYEEGSDAGNMRYYPKGKLIKSLIENHVTNTVLKYGAMEVETPIMYDYEHPALKSYLERFPARQYTVLSGEDKFFLRFSACFGQFLIAKDAVITYKQLPVKLYELTRYSFRREKHGELVGLRRLRAFTMPDMHTLAMNMEQAKDEFMKQYKMAIEILKDFNINIDDYEVAIRFTREFFDENKDFIFELQKIVGKPVLVQIWDEKFFYFVLKFEFNFVDNLKKAAALSTVQIDVDNAKRFNITYINEKGERSYPYILHCSPTGAVERIMYAMLEKAQMDIEKNKKPQLPLWLSPTQVRIIPVSENHMEKSKEIMENLTKRNIRADLDDRELSLAKKIREAEKSWIPYIVVVGDKEIKTGKLNVRKRNLDENREMEIDELALEILNETGNFPFRPLNESPYLSQRIKFS